MRGGHLGGGGGLAHRPLSSIDRRLCLRLRCSGISRYLRRAFPGNEKSPRTGGDAAPMPAGSHRPVLISAAR
ncbi:hypothetical protein BLA24_21035 [Streptomyces cinnamoneus]|uniref:Uncharacterized protein n=1 Tax=Streptomyces cinnamoneus TaxID=53446 RepID=A0A2G1XFR7_STRCJ|nr:hypothetical protein BLA24_21035 [Streptomyces cinnamoneus]PPT13137.1 hypothetical protein CYQ11_09750 [Streptomyces cinnamoneus]